MRNEPLEVPGERPREPEEADGDDRDGQGKDRRLLGGAGDEVAGRRHQGDAEADGKAPRRTAESAIGAVGGAGRLLPTGRSVCIRRPPPRARRCALRRGARSGLPVGEAQGGARPGGPCVRLAAARRRRDELRVLRIEVRRRLVEDHERGIAKERPGQGQPLKLSCREGPSAVADDRVVAERRAGG